MTDLLVRLYDLPDFEAEARVRAGGISVRRSLAPERHIILDWVHKNFTPAWRSEAALGLSQIPSTVYVAVKMGVMLGFACYDTSAKGFFGPTGVSEAARGHGVRRC